MKRILAFLAAVHCICGCSYLSQVNWNTDELAKASASALTAMSITDAQVIALCQSSVKQMDAESTIDNGSYKQRLDKLLSNVKDINGLPINYQVYMTKEVNAFACGDGSIRVYSGLMDVMDDAELMAIIGHECGHVAHQDSKKAMKNAYLASAARGVLNAAGGTVGTLSQTVLGDLGEAFVTSQYSQKQEYKADDYGFEFAASHGYSPYSMYNALNVLVDLSGGKESSLVMKMFSSHPGSAERAQRMKEKADALAKQ